MLEAHATCIDDGKVVISGSSGSDIRLHENVLAGVAFTNVNSPRSVHVRGGTGGYLKHM